MKRPVLFAFAGVALLFGGLGSSLALGFHPVDAVTAMFEDPCDGPDEASPGNATAPTQADPCGDGESQDDGK